MSSRTPMNCNCPERRRGALVILAALLAFLSSGCATTSMVHVTPTTPELEMRVVHPVAVDYELLGFVTGHACEDLDILKKRPEAKLLKAEPGTGHPVVYQAAKYDALEKADAADNLISIRVKVEEDKKQQCVTLTGRAYRITSVKAEPAGDTASIRVSSSPLTASRLVASSRSLNRMSKAWKASRPIAPNQLSLTIGTDSSLPLSLAYSRQGRFLAWELGATYLIDWEDLVPYTRLSAGYTLLGWIFPYVSVTGGYYIDYGDPYLSVGAGIDLRRRGLGLKIHTEVVLDRDVSFIVGPTFNF